jgi:hypothetical protein
MSVLTRLLAPVPPPYDALAWEKKPFAEKSRMVCQAWALQGYGTPPAVYAVYGLKVLIYAGAWALFCSATPGMELGAIGSWWLEPIAFQKAILWSMLFEILGLGCGSGPLTGRYHPPLGGALYFLRPGTTKLPPFPALPLLGGSRRSWLDVAIYLALAVCLLRALVAPALDRALLVPIVVLLPVLGLCDRTPFLAARAEHYLTTVLCFVLASPWLGGAKSVWLALWLWAGVSKLNHHFPAVVGVMTSNSPVLRMRWLRERMYRRFPDDLRPSRLAAAMGHVGTFLELAVPLVLAFATGGTATYVGLAMMLALHGYITSNVPMGVPIEWNVMMVYGALFLFGAHAEVSAFAVGSPWLGAILVAALVAVPLLGNLFPERFSFLLSMRYYAGNWACSVWLFAGESYRKLDRLTKSSAWIYDQLARFYDRKTAVGLVGKVIAFRAMHLHGRALQLLLPRAVEKLEDYEYVEGELVAGMVLGWNFGDGHLHHEQLLAAVQAQCGFEAGELRCLFIEPQALFGSALRYRIADAKTGVLEAGSLPIARLRELQPWAAG